MKTKLTNSMTRRTFVAGSAVGLTALSAGRAFGANDRVNVGVIGVGLIGRILTRGFVAQPDVNVVGISETYQPRMNLGVEPVSYTHLRAHET